MLLYKKIVFVLFSLLFFSNIAAQNYVYNYEHLTTQKGLSNNFINCVVEDKQGFMWFGTQDGLCRYDGKNYVVYKTNEKKNIFLNSITITSLALQNDSIIWVGTAAGLHILNTYQKEIQLVSIFKESVIDDIFIDDKKTIWVVADRQIYNRKQNQTLWNSISKTNNSLKNKEWAKVTQVETIKNKALFFVRRKETDQDYKPLLYSFDTITKKYQPINNSLGISIDFFDAAKSTFIAYDEHSIKPKHTTALSDFPIHFIAAKPMKGIQLTKEFSAKKHQNHLYIPLYETIYIFDLTTYQKVGELNLLEVMGKIGNPIIKGFLIDKSANLWVATFGEGIFIFPIYGLQKIRMYQENPDNPQKSISNSSVRSIYQDESTQNLWIGTYSTNQQIDIFIKDSIKKTLPIKSQAYIIKEDIKNTTILWIATYNGILKIDKTTFEVKKRFLEKERIRAFLQVSDSILLFGNEDSIYVMDAYKEQILYRTNFTNNTTLYKDKQNTIWLGTETEGFFSLELNCFYDKNATKKATLKQKKGYNPHKNKKITTWNIKSFYEDSQNRFWIATTRGLYLFDKEKETFKRYNEQKGLPNNVVYGMLEDENYNLWLSTNKGISKFDIEKESFENFTIQDGLQDDEFNGKSFFKSNNGEFFFGGIRGLNAFYPKNMTRNSYIPPLVLIDLKRFGKSIQTEKPIEKISSFSFSKEEAQMLTFEVAALNFYQSNRNEYAYKIEEIDTTWIELGTINQITLTNLAAGNYTLHIKGSNNHGNWNEEGILIHLKIIPPFWERLSFQVFIFAVILLIVLAGFRFRFYLLKQRQILLEIQIKERTSELADSNKMKDQLFAIIAHDLRNPITAFQGITEQINFFLRKNKPERLLQMSESIDNSVQNINHLLNNLLNWALTQTNQLTVQKTETNLFQNVEEVVKIYQMSAVIHQIEVENTVSKGFAVYVDRDSFQTILRNLVGNAIKYTPQNGKISISAQSKKDKIILSITDTGIGINEEIKQKLFKLSIGNTSRGLRGEKGTGLGLVLCYQFAELNNIKIQIESKENEGTTFILTIPIKP